MIKETCAPPNVRYETLKQIVHIVQTNNAVCRAFGISTDPAGLKSLMGRVIEPLPLMYKDANGHRLAPTLTLALALALTLALALALALALTPALAQTLTLAITHGDHLV